jgi:hypothetical protein
VKGHREKLTQIAEQHGMPPLVGSMTPLTYANYALDLMMLGVGLLKPEEVDVPAPVEPEKKNWSVLPW